MPALKWSYQYMVNALVHFKMQGMVSDGFYEVSPHIAMQKLMERKFDIALRGKCFLAGIEGFINAACNAFFSMVIFYK